MKKILSTIFIITFASSGILISNANATNNGNPNMGNNHYHGSPQACLNSLAPVCKSMNGVIGGFTSKDLGNGYSSCAINCVSRVYTKVN